ncbi:hypothetical protein [Pseudomonas sp. BMS12]|uniref:hypothetical protein n=1 Tax=Pseudomonas sp. BMS12 TaxID=1796033 RepID=UPI00083A9569|nr:hypothetical protein [Pseudomonas sp. BMS12]
MANHRFRLLLAALAAGAGGAWLGYASLNDPAPLPSAASNSTDTQQTPPSTASAPDSSPDARQQLLVSPAVQNYQARLRFAADYQDFLQKAAELDAKERQRQAKALAEEIDRREAAAELALSEALLLQLGLAQAEGGDEETQKARADQLVARYQALSQQREAQRKAPDARFSQYKADEKRIVDEVLSMGSIPDGLSRDQYLRQRLQEAREQAYQ